MNQHYDLLVHVDLTDEKIFGIALSNVINYLDALPDEKYDVVILFTGPSASLLWQKNCPHLESITALQARGVQFQVCANALKKAELSSEDLVSDFTVVPAGVVALVDLQRQGFAYIKP